eukprot:7397965-Pyramimonas_sp.AAC.1
MVEFPLRCAPLLLRAAWLGDQGAALCPLGDGGPRPQLYAPSVLAGGPPPEPPVDFHVADGPPTSPCSRASPAQTCSAVADVSVDGSNALAM